MAKMLYLIDPHTCTCNIMHVASTAHLSVYIEKLRGAHIGPSGQINKLRTVAKVSWKPHLLPTVSTNLCLATFWL